MSYEISENNTNQEELKESLLSNNESINNINNTEKINKSNNIENEDIFDFDNNRNTRESVTIDRNEYNLLTRQSTMVSIKTYCPHLFLPMKGRDPYNPHRAATPLELFFDLCFVVAISQGATSLHHDLNDERYYHALTRFPIIFFGIWWPWMNVSFFASAYDTDDALYRLNILLICVGVLVFAAGIPRAFEEDDHTMGSAGWTIMRIGLILLYWRAWRSDKKRRLTCKIYAFGFFLCQLIWDSIILFSTGEIFVTLSPFCILLELSIPPLAEKILTNISIPWHAEHISERFGLLALIVLGETLLTITSAIQTEIDAYEYNDNSELVLDKGKTIELVIGALLICFSMWWLYFGHNIAHGMKNKKEAYFIGYGHYFIYFAIAATGSALAVTVDKITTDCSESDDITTVHHVEKYISGHNDDDHTSGQVDCGLSNNAVGLILATPVTLFLLSLLFIFRATNIQRKWDAYSIILSIPFIFASSFCYHTPILIGSIMLLLVLFKVLYPHYLVQNNKLECSELKY